MKYLKTTIWAGLFTFALMGGFTACSDDDPTTNEQTPGTPSGDDDGDKDDDDDSSSMLPEYSTPDRSTIPAFPNAQGAGRYVTGGAGGKVYTVTKLDDDGSEGTLRWAVNQSGARTIVFATGGVIELKDELDIINGNLTIAGQTAPGNGICIKGHPVVLKAGIDNVIVRFIRFRMGADDISGEEADGADTFWGRGISNVIVDHCSMSWSIDECASFYNNKNFTLQWCIISESLAKSKHSKEDHGYGGIWGGAPGTFHHNLLAHHTNRTPRMDGSRSSGKPDTEKVDFRNNVIYNWQGEGAYGGQGGSFNFINNYYKPGAYFNEGGSSYNRIFTAYADDGSNNSQNELGQYGQFYVGGNYFDSSVLTKDSKKSACEEVNNDNTKGLVAKNGFITTDKLLVSSPFSITEDAEEYTQSAKDAYESVLTYAGASHNRDEVDKRIVNEVRNGTFSAGNNGFINDASEVGGWPAYAKGTPQVDTDGDGMPDYWEKEKGLDPNNAADGAKYNLDKQYTNLEVYLNSLAESYFPGK